RAGISDCAAGSRERNGVGRDRAQIDGRRIWTGRQTECAASRGVSDGDSRTAIGGLIIDENIACRSGLYREGVRKNIGARASNISGVRGQNYATAPSV